MKQKLIDKVIQSTKQNINEAQANEYTPSPETLIYNLFRGDFEFSFNEWKEMYRYIHLSTTEFKMVDVEKEMTEIMNRFKPIEKGDPRYIGLPKSSEEKNGDLLKPTEVQQILNDKKALERGINNLISTFEQRYFPAILDIEIEKEYSTFPERILTHVQVKAKVQI